MKVQILSDLHLEFDNKIKLQPKTNILILAGDIGNITKNGFKEFFDDISLKWKHIIYVLGNHEYYHSRKTFDKLNKSYHNFFNKYKNIHLLDNDYIIINDTLFIGTTMFPEVFVPYTACFKQIKMKNENNWTVPITTDYWNNLHKDGKNRLYQIIGNHRQIKKQVIITHYPLTREGTSSPIYKDDDFERKKNFANEMSLPRELDFVNICGHTHYSFDFKKDNIRFISNQYGYDLSQRDNFKDDLVFDI